jgi:hypothetical protein
MVAKPTIQPFWYADLTSSLLPSPFPPSVMLFYTFRFGNISSPPSIRGKFASNLHSLSLPLFNCSVVNRLFFSFVSIQDFSSKIFVVLLSKTSEFVVGSSNYRTGTLQTLVLLRGATRFRS